MNSTINVNYTWEKEAVLANGADQGHLLVEWSCGTISRRKVAVKPKLIGFDLQLRIIPESGVKVIHKNGPRINTRKTDYEQETVLYCGHMFNGQQKHAIFMFSFDKHVSGKQPVATMEWSWHKPLAEKRTVIRSERIYIQFTYHLGLLQLPADPRVEKFVKLDESSFILKKALRAYEKGKRDEGSWKLRRHADELLLMAARTDDLEYLQEAEMFLGLQQQWDKTYRTEFCYSS
ncbi:hypothetical protein OIN60_19950 [Paenibacillus sp. P96]|uniref:Uncharacterized protein n=1 Tax=Paenibacillus zeirhizosphaerae TaxID=2987519 RepID=A0ABT9FWB0_9BACL|nr:hypothetical protein [Paenibacillus sp. P96]MDP4099002.1 hypothetical protein [Paenibacillus sp. P96]